MRSSAEPLALVVAALALAAGPLVWLVGTWTHPGFNPTGGPVLALAAGLLIASARSPHPHADRASHRDLALWALGAGAVVRVAGHLLGVDVVGGLVLVVDLVALAVWLDTSRRDFAVSPLWLGALATLALPLERLVQRALGYGLQQTSAIVAGELASWFVPTQRHGIQLVADGIPVLVDAPCSGARGLTVVAIAFCALAAMRRPTLARGALGVGVALAAALLGNAVRLTAVVVFVARPALTFGADPLHGPLHEAIGALGLATSLAIVLAWASRVRPAPTDAAASDDAAPEPAARLHRRSATPWFAAAAVSAALVAVIPAQRPFDASGAVPAATLPDHLGGLDGVPAPLTDAERRAYVRHGGEVTRMRYGAVTVLLVHTRSPLRHLHDPAECLTALGWTVTRTGAPPAGLPAGRYDAIAPDGSAWVVRASWATADGAVATSIPEVVWRWFSAPDGLWRAVLRIAPAGLDPAALDDLDRGLVGALALPESTH